MEPKLEKLKQHKAPQNEKVPSGEDHLLARFVSMGLPAGLNLSSCSQSVNGSDEQRFNVMSDVCFPPGYREASRTHYHPVRWHAQILLHEIHPLHEKEEKTGGEDEKIVGHGTGEATRNCNMFLSVSGKRPSFFSFIHLSLPLFFFNFLFSLIASSVSSSLPPVSFVCLPIFALFLIFLSLFSIMRACLPPCSFLIFKMLFLSHLHLFHFSLSQWLLAVWGLSAHKYQSHALSQPSE